MVSSSRRRLQFGLRSKLFVALLFTVILAVLATSIAARIAFMKGFVGYLNEQESTRVRALIPLLTQEYRRNGSWRSFWEDPGIWFEMLTYIDFRPGDSSMQWAGEMVGWGELPAPNPRDLTGLGLRLALLDQAAHFVAGNPAIGANARDARFEVIRLDGALIGWLAILPFERVTAGAAGAFQHRQLVSSWLIGLAAIGLAAAVALWVTHRLLKPIRRIGAATHRLAAGDYTTRLEDLPPDEIGRLAADFNRLALVLEKNESMRRSFMADVSHELRTPVAILRAEIEAIEDHVRDLTPEMLRSLQTEVRMLGKLINDLYDLSLADLGALTYRVSRTDVTALLRQRLTAFGERYAEQNITMEASLPAEPIVLEADEMRVQQLFNNLIENSLRYTSTGGRFRVTCHVEQQAAVIDLQDSEPAVAEDLLPRLFERFYRVDPSRNRATGGAGLGLAIAKSIVTAHGGAISARSSPLGGLWIRLSLPLAR